MAAYRSLHLWGASLTLAVALAACSEGSRNDDTTGIGVGSAPCTGSCQRTTPTRLEADEVRLVIARAVGEASARGEAATIAVVDRVGNVLAIYAMDGADATLKITSTEGEAALVDGGFERLDFIPSALGAISKALTATYFSSEGQAFTSRTANQIIQENFNPGEGNAPSGPLFGVQFSQLACSDISRRFNGVGPDQGSHRAPLGFAADPGGIPLYKNGTVVGAIGVMADGIYGLDKQIFEPEFNLDEIIAVAGSFGFSAPRDRRADRVTAEGKTLRFADVDFEDLASDPAAPGVGANFDASRLQNVRGYNDGRVFAGTAFGQPESGVRPLLASDAGFGELQDWTAPDGSPTYVVVDENNQNRFPPIAGTDGLLTQEEVRDLLLESMRFGWVSRSQVRRPVGDYSRLTVVVSDTRGAVLGVVRAEDTLVDAIDVTIQKARSVAFFSSTVAADRLSAVPPAEYLKPETVSRGEAAVQPLRESALGPYVAQTRSFIGRPNALADGAIAFSNRALGLIARPYFPDGILGTPNGPLSKPAGEWSLFSTGAELDLVHNAVVRHIAFVAGLVDEDVGRNCTGYSGLSDGLQATASQFAELPNGFTIFPGAVPIYRGNQLVGALASSGDGADQDGAIPFLGLDAVSRKPGSSLNNAPPSIRADQLRINGTNLRYVICPQAAYLGSTEEAACEGL